MQMTNDRQIITMAEFLQNFMPEKEAIAARNASFVKPLVRALIDLINNCQHNDPTCINYIKNCPVEKATMVLISLPDDLKHADTVDGGGV
jgi:hypothetical protein